MPHFKAFTMINLLLLFCSHIQSLVELDSVSVATTPYFEYTPPLTYSLWIWSTNNGFTVTNCTLRVLPKISPILGLAGFTKSYNMIGVYLSKSLPELGCSWFDPKFKENQYIKIYSKIVTKSSFKCIILTPKIMVFIEKSSTDVSNITTILKSKFKILKIGNY